MTNIGVKIYRLAQDNKIKCTKTLLINDNHRWLLFITRILVKKYDGFRLFEFINQFISKMDNNVQYCASTCQG